MAEKKRNSEIDLLKFLFSVLIMLFHCRKMFTPEGSPLFQSGYTAVEFFFIVSGYLMANSARKYKGENIAADTFDFMKKKLSSLMPFVFAAFIITFISVEAANKFNIKKLIFKLIGSLQEVLFLKMFGTKSISYYNGPSWYISAMLIAMLAIFPLLLKYKNKFSYIAAPLAAGVIYACISQNYIKTIVST